MSRFTGTTVLKVVDGLIRQVGHGIYGLVEGTLCALVAGQTDEASPNLAHVVRSGKASLPTPTHRP